MRKNIKLYCSDLCKGSAIKEKAYNNSKFAGREDEFYNLYVKHKSIHKALTKFLGYKNACYYYNIARKIISDKEYGNVALVGNAPPS